MRSPRTLLVVGAVLGGVGLLAVNVALAQTEPPEVEYEISPTSGPAGTVITYSGEGCLTNLSDPTGPEGTFFFLLDDNATPETQPQEKFEAAPVTGTFTDTFTVPAGTTIGQSYATGIRCPGPPAREAGFNDPDTPRFTVTATPTSTTSTTATSSTSSTIAGSGTTPTTTTTTTGGGSGGTATTLPTSRAATAVPGQASFTG